MKEEEEGDVELGLVWKVYELFLQEAGEGGFEFFSLDLVVGRSFTMGRQGPSGGDLICKNRRYRTAIISENIRPHPAAALRQHISNLTVLIPG